MREYIFHGKRVDGNGWIEGSLWNYLGTPKILSSGNIVGYDVIPESVGQYTGMNEFVVTDRSYNKPLFEGDIVEVWSIRRPKYASSAQSQYDGDVKVRATICFKDGAWRLDYENKYNKSLAKLQGKETDERAVDNHWELYMFSPYYNNDEWLRENKFKWHDIKKIGTVFENADLLEG